MLGLEKLNPSPGSTKQKKRIGRGQGTGQGKQAGKGHKGFKARSGSSIRPGFEGGQMPLHRRLPKRGFKNPIQESIGIVNVEDLNIFNDDTFVDTNLLHKFGLVKKKFNKIKLLGDGELSKRLVIKLEYISNIAKKKIEVSGGKVEV